jgi:hypothetical protein
MKRLLPLIAAAIFAGPALAADVGVAISIGQPNFYGHIEIGGAPPPVVIYQQPRVIVQSAVVYEPIYLRVRAGEAQDWPRYCGAYNACGRPVYFVQDDYYSKVYAPHYREHHGNKHGAKKAHKNGKGHH